MTISVKICGLKDRDSVIAAVENGADYLGVVFFPPSPRNIDPEQAAEILDGVPSDVTKVGLFVDPNDEFLDTVLRHVRLDLIQLHGKESPTRVEEVRQKFGLEVMKACPISESADIEAARAYEEIADRLLFDAKPPKGATRPGGNAVAFDWALLKDVTWSCPWMLAGGLHQGNVLEAVKTFGATAIDISSGVESEPGVKSPEMIRQFLATVKP
ncbi:MAG: phosphoribosylanthranilate isomerase [Rhodospirillales bacterium]|nr:phosphoribosylanthranilate isomerase [Rhodospirillales bacterium]